jgi:predicted membrane channel-forming protein YqfA (hemolysin III family)
MSDGMDMHLISVVLVAVTAATYGYMNLQALAMHAGCDEGTPQDEHFKRYWGASLIIAATMATTILILKFMNPNGPIFMALLSLIGSIGAGMYWKTLRDCESEEEKTKEALYFLGGFIVLFFLSFAMYRRGGPVQQNA